jgi:hypothetical protein
MVYQPTPQDDERQQLIADIRERTENRISSFDQGDFEWEHTDAFAALKTELGHYLLAAWFAGWVDFAGKELDADDLRLVGLDPRLVDLDELNAYVEEEDLDRLVADTTERIPPAPATGEAVFLFGDRGGDPTDGEIPARTLLVTPGDIEFRTLEAAEYGATDSSVVVPIEAVVPGPVGNIGPGTPFEIPSSEVGTGLVEEAITRDPVTGGEIAETTPELRERARRAKILTSGGVTEVGEKGRIISELPGTGIELDDIAIIEYPDPTVSDSKYDYPHAIVVVDGGGADDEVQAAIDIAKEHGIRHELERPTTHTLDVTGTLIPDEYADTSDINVERAEERVIRFLAERSLGEDVSIEKLIAQVFFSEFEDIGDIDDLVVTDETGTEIVDDYSVTNREVIDPGTVTFSTP